MCATVKKADNEQQSEGGVVTCCSPETPFSFWEEFKKGFRNLWEYELETFQSYENFSNWLHRSVDGAALGVFRLCYGAAMLIDIAEERDGGQMDVRFGEPKHCHFPLFDGLRAVKYPVMGCIYLCMWMGAMGIMLGYRFKLSCLGFVLPYWYIFLLDKPAWNNHSYLFGLIGSILLFTKANHYCSVDRLMNPSLPTTVPYWNYFLIKFQFFILYMYAGLKKLTTEWLSGYAMSSLSHHWVFTPFRSVLSPEMTDLIVVHWFTAIFDFSIAFLMTCQKTRIYAFPFMVSFHLMNSRLFVIGMFPWVCLAQVPMFFGFDWPRKLGFWWRSENPFKSYQKEPKTRRISDASQSQNDASNDSEDCDVNTGCDSITSSTSESGDSDESQQDNDLCKECCKYCCEYCAEKLKARSNEEKMKNERREKINRRTSYVRSSLILLYCAIQLFLPYSHFITKGYNNWTNGLYGYSWDMMVHSYDTILTSIKIVDNSNNKVHYLNPYAFTEYDRWTKYADMAVQYAKCIENNIRADLVADPENSPLASDNFSIYFDIWCSMNGRFQQRVFDPRTDLLKAEWSPFERTLWSLPLLNELNHMRPRLKAIAHEVLAWNNYSDVIFVADFPGLTLDNFISADLTNVSVTILEGNVRYQGDNDNESYFLTAGKSIALRSDAMHHVTTIGSKPSCYMYTYVNKTMLESEEYPAAAVWHPIGSTTDNRDNDMLPLWQEFKDRLFNYLKFLRHMGNCVLNLLYGVPIPMEIRERE